MSNTKLTVANEIRDQLGNKALFMLGAKNLMGGENFLSFRIRGSKKVNYVKIALNAMDTYDMEFGKIWGGKYKVVTKKEGVYNDMLHVMISENTGLYTSL